jgi:hypothetical protein
MTRETWFARVLLVLVFAPAGGLFGKAVAEAAQARPWWPWLLAALVWLLLSGAIAAGISTAVSHHAVSHHAVSHHDVSHHDVEHR